MPLEKVRGPEQKTEKKKNWTVEDFNSDDEFDPNSGWITLLYSSSGGGKTWFAGTANNSFFINTGGGIDTLMSPLFLRRYPNIRRKKVDIIERMLSKNEFAFDVLTDLIDWYLENDETNQEFNTVILDDATSLRDMIFNHGKGTKSFVDVEGMRKAGIEINRLSWFLEQYVPVFRAKGINFLMTAHESRIYEPLGKMGEERKIKEIRPSFAGEKQVDYVPSKFDEVWYTRLAESKDGKFSMIITEGGGEKLLTKTRKNGVFKPTEIGMNYEQLLAKRKANKLDPYYLREKK